mgnify:CR=1 FL=1
MFFFVRILIYDVFIRQVIVVMVELSTHERKDKFGSSNFISFAPLRN